MDAEATNLVTTVIWTLRICLPIILFLLYYRVPFPDFLPKKHRHNRDKMLMFRPGKAKPPAEMATMGLVGQARAPHLFVAKKRAGKGESRGADPAKAEEPEPAKDRLTQHDTLHLESLLNYMAFNRKSHRIFHPLQPPPPPSAPPPPNNAAPSLDFQLKANLDAQMVLKGALMFKKLEVVTDVYDSLTNTKVEPSEQTFALMVEVCIVSHALPKASDFLMKMERCGYSPDAPLLDRVMELYAQHKVTTELGQRLAEKSDHSNGANGLSADASEFVPTATAEWAGGGAWPAWSWDDDASQTPGKGKAGKDSKGKGKGDKGWSKGWNKWPAEDWSAADKSWKEGWKNGWNKWQSEDLKTQAPKGNGKSKGKGHEKGKGKGKESASEMPAKAKEGAVWRKKEQPQDAEA